jgi:hypothetical protein
MTTERLLDGEWLSQKDREQYDEAQGLTLEMVADYFKRRDWTSGADSRYALGSSLRAICALERMTLQRLLREINPRMRQGKPSNAALEIHGKRGGLWIACIGVVGFSGSIMVVSLHANDDEMAIWDEEEWHNYEYAVSLEAALKPWSFWPCDERGNKVRWPENAAGEML